MFPGFFSKNYVDFLTGTPRNIKSILSVTCYRFNHGGLRSGVLNLLSLRIEDLFFTSTIRCIFDDTVSTELLTTHS